MLLPFTWPANSIFQVALRFDDKKSRGCSRFVARKELAQNWPVPFFFCPFFKSFEILLVRIVLHSTYRLVYLIFPNSLLFFTC